MCTQTPAPRFPRPSFPRSPRAPGLRLPFMRRYPTWVGVVRIWHVQEAKKRSIRLVRDVLKWVPRVSCRLAPIADFLYILSPKS